MNLIKLLNILSDGEFHSGSEIGEKLGVSRTAVWKQFQKLNALGLKVDSVKGKGYRIDGGFELLDEASILAGLIDRVKGNLPPLTILEQVGSTNDYLLSLSNSERPSGQVCIAEMQTKGKGRRGRPWISSFGSSVCLSVAWTFDGGILSIEGLSLAIGVAVSDALSEFGVKGAELKWPNDILYDGHKLGGVLIEVVGDAAGPCEVVIGVGINVKISPHDAGRIDQKWVDINEIQSGRASRNKLVSYLLNEIVSLLAGYHQDTFAAYKSRWEERDAFRGKEVLLMRGSNVTVGIASGVSDKGAICVIVDGEKRYFDGGEISLRGIL